MSPEELVRESLDLEAQFLVALGEDKKAEAVRSREPAEPAPPPHRPFTPPLHVGLREIAPVFGSENPGWSAARRELEPPQPWIILDHFGRVVPGISSLLPHPAEDPLSANDS